MYNQKSASYVRLNLDILQNLNGYLTYNKTVVWYNVLNLLERKIYSTKTHSTGFAPKDVNSSDSEQSFLNMFRKILKTGSKPNKFHLGKWVRIQEKRNIFAKSFKPQSSKEVYKIVKIIISWPVFSYKLQGKDSTTVLPQFFVNEKLAVPNE